MSEHVGVDDVNSIAGDPGAERAALSDFDPVPIPGDDGYRAFLNRAVDDGHLTDRERRERRLIHGLVLSTRGIPNEREVLREVDELLAEGVLEIPRAAA